MFFSSYPLNPHYLIIFNVMTKINYYEKQLEKFLNNNDCTIEIIFVNFSILKFFLMWWQKNIIMKNN